MSTTDLRTGRHRTPKGRLRPNFDRLESRLALSGLGADFPLELSSGSAAPAVQDALTIGTSSPIASADPGPASVVEKSPSALTVTFDPPVDPLSLGAADFSLVHVAADGSTSPLTPSEASLSEAMDPADPSGSRIVLTLSRPLTDGQYRLTLLGANQLQERDGQFLSASGTDVEVSTFTVATPRRGLGQAVDLGTATTSEAVHPDNLDLSGMPGDFRLYKLDVPTGHLWQLGLEVSTGSAGNPLVSVLSLFDARGNPIATSSQGGSGASGDPFLFAGVSPGTYYVGVSGEGNVPGEVGGYDPVLGVVGTSGTTQAGGDFQLHFVADPADQPTTVVGLGLDQADPDSTVPTGLTVQFSGSLRVADLLQSGKTSLTVVDASGQSWAVKILQYDESLAELSVAFDQALPPGLYTLEAPDGSGLVDLAGRLPVAPGQPSGVLGTFEISTGTTAPDDLGAILPGAGPGGVSASVVVNPGDSVVKTFTVIEPGYYSIVGVGGSTNPSFSLARADGPVIAVSSSPDGSGKVQGFLRPGSYSLTVANPGTQAFAGSIKVVEEQSGLASLLVGGVAQGPALNLRLIAPTLSPDTSSSTSNNSASGIDPQSPSSPSTGVGTVGPSSSAPSREAAVTPGVGSGSIPLFTTGPVGRPSSSSEQISVVGPSGPSGSMALASNSGGLSTGLVGVPTRASRGAPGESRRDPATRPGEVPEAPAAPGAEIDFGLISQDRARGADDKVLFAADWIDRIAAMSLERLDFLTGPTAPSEPRVDGGEVAAAGEVVAEAQAPTLEPSRMEVASIAPSVGIGLLAMIAYRNRHRIVVKIGQGRKPEPRTGRRPHFGGPRRRSPVPR